MKKYRTTIWPLALVFFLCIIAFAFFGSLGVKDFKRTLIGVGIFAFVPFIVIISFGLLTYEGITAKGYLKHVVCALFRRKINIHFITYIIQEGTYYVFQNTVKSIYIYYTNQRNQERFLHLSMSLYDTKILQKLFKDLLGINSKIKFDKATQRILETGK